MPKKQSLIDLSVNSFAISKSSKLYGGTGTGLRITDADEEGDQDPEPRKSNSNSK